MDGWKKVTLDNICEKITDGAHQSPKTVSNGLPMASVKDLTQHGINFSTCRLISKEDFSKLEKQNCKPRKDDVLISKDGNSALETVCIMKNSPDVVLLSSVAILRPDSKKINPMFLRFYLDSNSTKKYLSNFISGAAIPRVVLKDFRRAFIYIPKIYTQQKIVEIILSYDQLIENNEKRIKILKEMAQRFYEEWFVKFKFPGYEKVKMVDSETKYGMIPEGWEVKRLQEFAYLIMGQSPKSEFYNEKGNGLPFHQGVKDFNNFYPTNRIYSTAGIRIAESGDLLFSVRAPVGRMNIAFCKIIIGRGLCSIRHKDNKQAFLYSSFYNRFIEKDMLGNGAIYKSINKDELSDLFFIYPIENLIDDFNDIAKKYFNEIETLTKDNKTLEYIRDLLIENLITGKRELKN